MANKSSYPWGKPPVWVVWVTFGGLAVWMVSVWTGTRLPYIYTEFSYNVRVFVLFPIILGLLIYFGFIYHRQNEPTGYQQTIGRIEPRRERYKAIAWSLLGAILLPGGIAWTSVAFPAWMAKLTASEAYQGIYQVSDVTQREGAVITTLFDIDLVDYYSGEAVTLRLNRDLYDRWKWKSGESICIYGRTSIFGTIIDGTTRDLSRCKE